MSEPDYKNFVNRNHLGGYVDEREAKLREEWREWKKNKKKTWYL